MEFKQTREEIFKSWLAALRSGEYQQTVGYLSKNNAYCCLGLLCELMEIPSTPGIVGSKIYDGNNSFLPRDLSEHLGIAENGAFHPKLTAPDPEEVEVEAHSLAELNDYAHWGFEEIADFIEEELLNPDSPYKFS